MLRENQLYAKLSKCLFYQRQIQYLGHIVSEERITMDPKKIKVTREWLTPWNVSEAKSFMGSIEYYKRFIEGFFKIAHPITSLKKKELNLNGYQSAKKVPKG